MSRRPVGDPCPGLLARLAQSLAAQGRLPPPAELGVTAEELARCLERAGQALAAAQAPPGLPFGAGVGAPARDPAPAPAKDSAPPPDPGSRPHILHADGGSRGNPGPAGAGAALLDAQGGQVALLKRYLGVATNNVAEYQGLIMGLE